MSSAGRAGELFSVGTQVASGPCGGRAGCRRQSEERAELRGCGEENKPLVLCSWVGLGALCNLKFRIAQ